MLEQEGGKLSYDRTNKRLAHESRYIDDQGNGGEYKYIHDFKSVSRLLYPNICLVHLSCDDNLSVCPIPIQPFPLPVSLSYVFMSVYHIWI